VSAGSGVRAALISSDEGLRETVQAFCLDAGHGVSLVLDVNAGVGTFNMTHLADVRRAAPTFVFVDLEEDADLGLQLVRHLTKGSDQMGPVAVVALGPPASAEMLLAAMRAGVLEYLPKPVDEAALLEAADRVRPRLAPIVATTRGHEEGKIFAVFSPKGGAGSTTLTVNLAIDLHRVTKKQVLLVDLDAELGEISLLLGVQPKFNFVDLVQNFHRMDSGLLASYIERHDSGVNLLSAPYHPDRAATVSEDQIRKILRYLKGQYDYVVIDTSKSFAPTSLAAFEQADQVFLVATVDLPNLRNIQRALPLIRRVMPRPTEQVRLVVNRYEEDQEIPLADVERTLGLPVFATLSNDYEAVIRSINSGKPVILNGKSPYSRDVKRLVQLILGRSPTEGEHVSFMERLTSAFRIQKADKAGSAGREHRHG
jgi:pilus assembly protein CpaE